MAASDEIFRIRMQQNVEQEARKASAALARVDAEVSELRAAFERGAVATERYQQRMAELRSEQARVSRQLTSTGEAADRAHQRLGNGSQRAGQGMMQLTYIMDDAAYGARGLRNQVAPLATALLGFGPAGAAVALAGTVLVGVFNEQIDSALAWAGILDENLVKGMNRGEEATEKMTTAVERLGERLKTLPTAAQEAGRNLATAFEGGGAEGQGRIVQQLIGEGFDSNRAERQEVEDRIARGESLRDQLGPMDFMTKRSIDANISKDRDRLVGLRQQREQDAAAAVEEMIAQAASGDQGAGSRLSALARRAGQADFAAEVDRQRGMPGPSLDIAGPDRSILEAGLKEQEADRQLRADADKATAEARKISVADAFEGIIGVDSRVDQGLRDKIAENMAAGMDAGSARAAAGGDVAANLARELSDEQGLPKNWAKEEAENFVRERGKALRDGAAGEAMDPASLELERLGLMKAQLGLMPEGALSPRGASTIGAESFAQSVQGAGAKSMVDLQKEAIGKQEALIKINQDMKRILERGGLLGA